jgi:hypothetical protein
MSKSQSGDVVRVMWWVNKGMCGTHGYWKYDRDVWDKMTPEERAKELDENLQSEIGNLVDAGWHIEEGE